MKKRRQSSQIISEDSTSHSRPFVAHWSTNAGIHFRPCLLHTSMEVHASPMQVQSAEYPIDPPSIPPLLCFSPLFLQHHHSHRPIQLIYDRPSTPPPSAGGFLSPDMTFGFRESYFHSSAVMVHQHGLIDTMEGLGEGGGGGHTLHHGILYLHDAVEDHATC